MNRTAALALPWAVAIVAAAAAVGAWIFAPGGSATATTGPQTGGRSATLDAIKSAGAVRCGVSQGQPGFSNPDAQGRWSGMDVEFCRALAAAIFDDPNAVRFVPLNSKERFTALQAGEVHLLSRNTTWTLQRDTALGLEFAFIWFYDGQGFMAKRSLGVTSARQLNNVKVCTQAGTTNELNAADFFRSHGLKYEILVYDTEDQYVAAYDSGRCDVETADHSGLYGDRMKLSRPQDSIILPEVISKEPLGPAVRHGDPAWGDIVRWVGFATLNAEELGVTSKNIDQMLVSTNPEIRRLLGKEGAFGTTLGLTSDWVVRIVRHVGNYGEIYDRTVGRDSPLKIDRGQNRLWKDGGLQYAPPVR
jgi:general L-amino acid transport system substrate-binding protein